MPEPTQTAVLGGGCFWCVEAVFQELEGVHRVQSGYAGGHVDNPSYEQVCGGHTGHVEVAQITFDPAVIGFRDLLEVFFTSHDPTTPDRQGNDVGPQYRSAIFWQTPEQRDVANEVIQDLTTRRVFDAPIVTHVLPPARFWPAESYHDDYYRLHPEQGYCAYVIAPKVAKLRKSHAHRLKR